MSTAVFVGKIVSTANFKRSRSGLVLITINKRTSGDADLHAVYMECLLLDFATCDRFISMTYKLIKLTSRQKKKKRRS